MAKSTTKATGNKPAKRAPRQNKNTPNSNEAAGEVRGTAQPGPELVIKVDAANLAKQTGSSHVQGPDNTALNSSSTPEAATPLTTDETPGAGDQPPVTVDVTAGGTEAKDPMASGKTAVSKLQEVLKSIAGNGLGLTMEMIAAKQELARRLGGERRVEHLLQRYRNIYPSCTHLLVSSDGQIFLPGNQLDAMAHQRQLDKDKELVTLPLEPETTELNFFQ